VTSGMCVPTECGTRLNLRALMTGFERAFISAGLMYRTWKEPITARTLKQLNRTDKRALRAIGYALVSAAMFASGVAALLVVNETSLQTKYQSAELEPSQ
jgi:hypothetical protein